MDRFNEGIYGKVLWECYRSKVYIVMLSLMYVLLGAATVIWAMDEGEFPFYVLAVVVIFFCLWRINRVHHPVALICERKLLVAVPWSFFTFDLLHHVSCALHAGGVQGCGRRLEPVESFVYRRQRRGRTCLSSCTARLCFQGWQV